MAVLGVPRYFILPANWSGPFLPPPPRLLPSLRSHCPLPGGHLAGGRHTDAEKPGKARARGKPARHQVLHLFTVCTRVRRLRRRRRRTTTLSVARCLVPESAVAVYVPFSSPFAKFERVCTIFRFFDIIFFYVRRPFSLPLLCFL